MTVDHVAPADAIVTPSTSSVAVLDYVPVFLAIAQAGSVALAAAQLHRSASAVTRALGELESGLGLSLFERKPRGMLLNRVGAVVLRRALRVQDEVQQACDEFLRLQGQGPAAKQMGSLSASLYSHRKLQLLIALAEHRHLSAAAKRLDMTQAGASMALARLEAVLGTPLFQRMLQGMVPSDSTTRLIVRARRILSEMRQLDADISALSGELSGVVSIGVLPLGRTFIVPSAVAQVVMRYPRVRIVIVENAYEQLLGQLRNGDIDVLFGALRGPEDCPGMSTEALFDDTLGFIVRAGHPLTQMAAPLTMATLLQQQWILPRPHAPGRRLIDSAFQALGLSPPTPTVETGDLAVIRQLLCCSNLLTAISPRQLLFEIRANLLVELPVAGNSTTRQIGLTTRQGALLSPATQALMQALRDVAQI